MLFICINVDKARPVSLGVTALRLRNHRDIIELDRVLLLTGIDLVILELDLNLVPIEVDYFSLGSAAVPVIELVVPRLRAHIDTIPAVLFVRICSVLKGGITKVLVAVHIHDYKVRPALVYSTVELHVPVVYDGRDALYMLDGANLLKRLVVKFLGCLRVLAVLVLLPVVRRNVYDRHAAVFHDRGLKALVHADSD